MTDTRSHASSPGSPVDDLDLTMYSVLRFVTSFLVTVAVFFGVLLVVGRTGRAGGAEVLLIFPVAAFVGVYTWRRLRPRVEDRAPTD